MIPGNSNQNLQTSWKNSDNEEMPLLISEKGQTGKEEISFKLLKKQMIIRCAHFTLFKGLEKLKIKQTSIDEKENAKVYFKEVVIKKYETISRKPEQFTKPSKPRQYDFLDSIKAVKNGQLRRLQFKQEFYLVMSRLEHTLNDKIKSGVRQFRELKQLKDSKTIKGEFITDFAKQMLDLMSNYHNSSPSLFLGGLRPTYIGVSEKFENDHKMTYSYSIIDFCLANRQPRDCLELYDRAYLAPQHVHCIDHRADIWSFGCILFELLSCGDRLVHDLDFHNRKDQQQFVQDRLNELTYRMECSNAGKFQLSLGTLKLLDKCLRADPRERASLEQLMQMVVGERVFWEQAKPAVRLGEEERHFWEAKVVYDISMQIFRLTCIQDSLMSIFEEMFFNRGKTVGKFHLYPLAKFASCYYLDLYTRLKDKARLYAKNPKWDKHSQVKRIQEEKKITDIREKAGAKMIKELQQEKKIDRKKEVLRCYPEVRDTKVACPVHIFDSYLAYVRQDLCRLENATFYKFIIYMHFYLKELPEMERYLNKHTCGPKVSLQFTQWQLRQHKDPEIAYFHRANEVSERLEQRVRQVLGESEKARESVEEEMRRFLNETLEQ